MRSAARGGPTKNTGPRIAVIGGGLGGIAVAIELVQAGIMSFTVFEQAPSWGGCWWRNDYPGAEVDTVSAIYSFGSMPNNWSRTHAARDEMLAYVERVVAEFNLDDHFRPNTNVLSAEWNEKSNTYLVRTEDGEALTFDVVIAAVGQLNVPRYPDWPGLADFSGPTFHTARWEHEHDLTGKRVAVVGSGASAAQVVPALAAMGIEVVQFQREPVWVRPKLGRDFTVPERQTWTPKRQRKLRRKLIFKGEWPQIGGRWVRQGSKVNERLRTACVAYLNTELASRPDLQAVMTPDYPYFGKRPVVSDDYYASLLRDNVRLVPKGIVAVTERGPVDQDGEEHPVDVLVLATGFRATEYISTLHVVGRNGAVLKEKWNGEPTALLGIAVPQFPNFFMLYGPNTTGGAVMTNLHSQSAYIIRTIRRMMRFGVTAIEVRPYFTEGYNRWLQKRLEQTTYTTANNYYKSESGRVVTNFPDSALTYGLMTRVFALPVFSTHRRRRSKAPNTQSAAADQPA